MTLIKATALNIYLRPCNPQFFLPDIRRYLILYHIYVISVQTVKTSGLCPWHTLLSSKSLSCLPAYSADVTVSNGCVSVPDRYRHPKLGSTKRSLPELVFRESPFSSLSSERLLFRVSPCRIAGKNVNSDHTIPPPISNPKRCIGIREPWADVGHERMSRTSQKKVFRLANGKTRAANSSNV